MRKKTPRIINQQRRNDTISAWLFLAPTLIMFAAFVVFPVLFSFFLSFTEWDFISGLSNIKWVGLESFKKIFEDEEFLIGLKNTFIYTVAIVPPGIVISLGLAYLLNNKVYLKKTLRLMFYIPNISNAVALTTVFLSLFRSNGPINNVLKLLGVVDLPKWFSDPNLTKIPIIIMSIWTGIGFQMIVYMAALQDVPQELYESAEIDGASGIQRFLKITVPMVSPTTFYLLIVRVMGVIKLFTPIKIISAQSSERSNTSVVMEIYREAFNSYNYGEASAMSWVLFVVILAVTLFQMWGQKKWVHY